MIKLSKRVLQFQSSGIRKIFDMAASLKNPVNFSIGQPDFPPSEKVKDAVINAVKNNIAGYTPTAGILKLREKVAQKFNEENQIATSTNQVIITPGSSAALFLALSVLIDESDEVIIPDPYFVEYPELVRFLGGVPILLDTYPDFQINPNKLKELITKKTKLIILNTPNNPTGAVYSKELLIEVAKIAKQHNLIIIADEIYEKFVYDGQKHFSIGSIYPNTITIGGLSKSGGVPGWRLCWATGPEEVINKMIELQQYTFVCAPSIVQHGALVAFDEIPEIINLFKKRRDLVFNLLSKKFNLIKPQGAFYTFFDVKDGEKFAEWAISQNVLVVPGSAFSKKNTHIRISYATSEENIEIGLTKLLDIK